MTVTVAYIGKRTEVEKALGGKVVRFWNGTAEGSAKPLGPIVWRRAGKNWRGDREVQVG